MLNRKFLDLRHAPQLDPVLVAYEPRRRPQAVLRLGPRCRPKHKGGRLLAAPGWTWAFFLDPDLRGWLAHAAIYDAASRLVAHHVDLACPAEEREGMLSFLDLKLDLLVSASGERSWLDRDEYQDEVRAGTIPDAWQEQVARAAAALDAGCASGAFPPGDVRGFAPPPRGPVRR